MREFVAEHYLPAAAVEAAVEGAGAARAAAEQLAREGVAVHFVGSVFVPGDETCIHLYRAESSEAVRTVAERASLRLERVSEAVSDKGATGR